MPPRVEAPKGIEHEKAPSFMCSERDGWFTPPEMSRYEAYTYKMPLGNDDQMTFAAHNLTFHEGSAKLISGEPKPVLTKTIKPARRGGRHSTDRRELTEREKELKKRR